MSFAITASTTEKIAYARQLAKNLDLVYVDPLSPKVDYHYLIVVTNEYIGIQPAIETKAAPFYIDFNNNKLLYRLQHISLRKELIARAIGAKPREQCRIIDATAGLGRDGLILAALGFKVALLERSPILYLMLKDGMDRAKQVAQLTSIIKRMELIHADAIHWLSKLAPAERPDIIYLDPMFPERQKSALVKKEMVLLQNIIGKDIDAEALLKTALTCAVKRVVVKRSRLSPNIGDITPNFTITGKKNRFDVYLT